VLGAGSLGAGCLDRPVTAAAPTIKTNFTSAVNQSGIDKVDILFDIDNSASMGDKQAFLIQAIPQMIARLVTPNCIDGTTGMPDGTTASPTTGMCSNPMSAPEFTAVHDMHIGVVTSSLGPRLGVAENGSPPVYVCDPNATVKSMAGASVSAFNDDQGHLINRTGPFGSGPPVGSAVDPAGPAPQGGFLYWYPALGNTTAPVSPPASNETIIGASGTNPSLVGDFTELVSGAGESGCGIESQLESWYRFLVQPDPYLSLVNPGGKASWSGVDTTILQQRHDFLRQDSLLAVIVLSDENDSEIDVRSFAGSGYLFMSQTYTPPRSLTPCLTNPNAAGCGPCPSSGSSDANCMQGSPAGVYSSGSDANDWGYNLNLRHVHMPQKYGLNPQYPLTRYFLGLTSTTVPNRLGEYPTPNDQYVEGPCSGAGCCTNPIFAKTLPTAASVTDAMATTPQEINTTLCNLPTGSVRQPSDVFYAHIGGVPHQLLQSTPGDGTCPAGTAAAECPQKDTLAPSDWIKILGQGPAAYTGAGGTLNYDYTGIDPHMIESMTPRNGTNLPNSLPTPASNPPVSSLSGPGFGAGADPVRPDPINGREWTTNSGVHSLPVDRQYACIFQLPTTPTNLQRDCSALQADTIEGNSCDCVPGGGWSMGMAPAATGNTPDQVPPLCSKASTDGSIQSSVHDYTVQTYAKAYPTTRELMLANMMGGQGIVSSLCPIHTDPAAGTTSATDPLYGYNPAVNAIVNRLKSALGSQCVPALQVDPKTGDVPCLVLVTFGPNASSAPTTEAECSTFGSGAYTTVDPTVLSEFQKSQAAMAGDAGGAAIAKEITCQLNQAPVPSGQSCVGGTKPGWCYVTGAGIKGGSTCSQEIAYSTNGLVPNGAEISLQCISTNQMGVTTGDASAGSSNH
jgi:hypothetical protein